MKKPQELTKEYGFWIIDGKYFKPDVRKDGKCAMVEVNKKEVKKLGKRIEELAEKLKENLDNKSVMKEALSKLDNNTLEELHNAVFNVKKKIKAKTRKHYCVDMKVGKFIIPIVE